jgi:DNA-binding MarR family transcriptional regulator
MSETRLRVRYAATRVKEVYPEADEAAIEVNLAVNASYAALRGAVSSLTSSLGLGRTAGRFAVLRVLALAHAESLSQKEIASELLITWAPLSTLIDGLERDAPVVREKSTEDRRVTLVRLTPKGKEACSRLIPAMANLSSQFCEGFDEREKRQLSDLLFRFSTNASRHQLAEIP